MTTPYLPPHPLLYQVSTRYTLQELGQTLGKPATLDDLPDALLDRWAELGFHWVWFLGVWQTGPLGRQVSLTKPEWQAEYHKLLPDWKPEDVSGSPFGVREYRLHQDFGDDDTLPLLRDRLHQRGMRLMLDFVPNHTALDCPWVRTHPEYYIHGTEADLAGEPHNYTKLETGAGPAVLAYGRDPYFPGWPDALQVNFRHAGLREARMEELETIASLCDGVRCDMAMLLLPEVIHRTWGGRSMPIDGTAPVDTLFWPEAIDRIKQRYPDFTFMAEVYWDLEWVLQQQGFDYTYDKRLYDRLVDRHADQARGHLRADVSYQAKSARFLENHDEPRANQVFPWPVHQAAALITYLTPGLRFFHDGQLEGRRVQPSNHLGRRPFEGVDDTIYKFYHRLLKYLRQALPHAGNWQLLDCRPAWAGNPTHEQFLTFLWHAVGEERLLVIVNYGPHQGQCNVAIPIAELHGYTVHLNDVLGGTSFDRWGSDMVSAGLYVDLPAWGYHAWEMIIQ